MDRQKILARMFREREKASPVEIEIEAGEEDEAMSSDEEAPKMALEDDSEPSLREQLNEEPLMGGPVEDDEEEGLGMDNEALAEALSAGGRTTPLRQRVLEMLRMNKKG